MNVWMMRCNNCGYVFEIKDRMIHDMYKSGIIKCVRCLGRC